MSHSLSSNFNEEEIIGLLPLRILCKRISGHTSTKKLGVTVSLKSLRNKLQFESDKRLGIVTHYLLIC